METPMQQHIDDLKEAKEAATTLGLSEEGKAVFESCIENAISFLPVELRAISSAYTQGMNDAP